MSSLDLKLAADVQKFLKSHSEKDIRTAVDKNWLKFHGEVSKYNPELKKLKKMDFLTYAKLAAKLQMDAFTQFVNAGVIPKGALTKSEEESIKKGYEFVNALFLTGGVSLLDGLQIGVAEVPVAAEATEQKQAA